MKTLTMRQAINEKCKDCNYDPLDKGNWRQQVASCEDTLCALHEYRPLDAKAKAVIKRNKLNSMSPIEREAYEKKAAKQALILASGRNK